MYQELDHTRKFSRDKAVGQPVGSGIARKLLPDAQVHMMMAAFALTDARPIDLAESYGITVSQFYNIRSYYQARLIQNRHTLGLTSEDIARAVRAPLKRINKKIRKEMGE